MIEKYAVEGKTDGAPNGHFYMTKSALSDIGKEVVESHMGFKGAKRDNFVKEQLNKYYPYHDVLGEGFLEVDRASVLLRQMLEGVEIGEPLQVQLEADVDSKADREHMNVMFRPNAIHGLLNQRTSQLQASLIIHSLFIATSQCSTIEKSLKFSLVDLTIDL